ncbi:hypothetical protein ACIA2T_16225 [Amycolatopsis japonica]|uniref:hypothetical protein n=1 Tax=Amycolatopsis japonica TaxID=208439 RepID=UPI0037BE19CA
MIKTLPSSCTATSTAQLKEDFMGWQRLHRFRAVMVFDTMTPPPITSASSPPHRRRRRAGGGGWSLMTFSVAEHGNGVNEARVSGASVGHPRYIC